MEQEKEEKPKLVKDPIALHATELILEQYTYGSFISYEWMESEIREDRKSTKFAFAIMTVVDLLKEQGLHLVRTGTHGKGFRILEKVEMQPHTHALEHRKVKGTYKNHRMLAAVNTQDMPEVERIRLEHERDKLGYLYLHASAILRKKKLPESTNPINPFQLK